MSKMVCFRASEELKDKLLATARRQGTNMSAVVMELLEGSLEPEPAPKAPRRKFAPAPSKSYPRPSAKPSLQLGPSKVTPGERLKKGKTK